MNILGLILSPYSGSQEDNQASSFGCPHSFLGRRRHKDSCNLLLLYTIGIQRELIVTPVDGFGKI